MAFLEPIGRMQAGILATKNSEIKYIVPAGTGIIGQSQVTDLPISTSNGLYLGEVGQDNIVKCATSDFNKCRQGYLIFRQ